MSRPGKLPFLICGCALLLAGCAKKDPPAIQRPPAPVSVVAAVTKDVPLYLDEVGRCVAREAVSVQPEVSGRITEIHFTDGADLKKGDVLFTIDPRPFQAQVDAAEANLAESKAALDLRQNSNLPASRIWSSRKPSPGRITIPGRTPWMWAKRRSN